MNTSKHIAAFALTAVITAGCSATHHAQDVRAADDSDRMTVGTVQREIRIGMSATDVATVLGSPNIVTTDDERLETWIYDKISTDVTYSRSSGTIVGLIFGSSAGGAGVGSTNEAWPSVFALQSLFIKYSGNHWIILIAVAFATRSIEAEQ